MPDPLVDFADGNQHVAKIVMSLRAVRLDPQRLLRLFQRFRRPARFEEHPGQIGVRHPTRRVLRDGVSPQGFLIMVNVRLSPGKRSQRKQQGS